MFLFYQAIAPFSEEVVADVPQLFCVFRWRDFGAAVITLQQENPPRHLHRCYPVKVVASWWEQPHVRRVSLQRLLYYLISSSCLSREMTLYLRRCNIYWWQHLGIEITISWGLCHMTLTLYLFQYHFLRSLLSHMALTLYFFIYWVYEDVCRCNIYLWQHLARENSILENFAVTWHWHLIYFRYIRI